MESETAKRTALRPTWLRKQSGDWPMTKLGCEVKENQVSSRDKRFLANCQKGLRREICNAEFENAERILIKTVQRECFPELRNVPIINIVEDNEGLLPVKTKIIECRDDHCFLTTILLPANCAITTRRVEYLHKSNCRADTQILLLIIGEKHWILKSRRTVRQIIRKCVVCRQYRAGPLKMLLLPCWKTKLGMIFLLKMQPEELPIAAVGMEMFPESPTKSEVPVDYSDQEVNPELTEATLVIESRM
ncbi:integrase catalytic domain-containing protein [Trichonephila inaurata madagascariensis]|uniref:Integrase catalytic domain-containing protein n=1 Tax=Trichonephila inaurata madagascariensis TaxID=2747483 RepID=A0A8X6ILV6_9ARAC|nr:integrase catalytic domain-containing protein [Trichonephila inaurata madagascariensis]